MAISYCCWVLSRSNDKGLPCSASKKTHVQIRMVLPNIIHAMFVLFFPLVVLGLGFRGLFAWFVVFLAFNLNLALFFLHTICVDMHYKV